MTSPDGAGDCPSLNLTSHQNDLTRVGPIAMIAAAALILVADLPWGDFQDHAHWADVGWIPFVSPPVRVTDIALNVFLGAPVGIAAALHFRRSLAIAGVIALTVSLIGEWSQLYSHSRFPSATDVASNLGGAMAACLAVAARAGDPRRSKKP